VTHIDPFAPADSPQHPRNFGRTGFRPEPPTEAEEFDHVTDAYWWGTEGAPNDVEEYATLFRAHATEDERALHAAHRDPDEYPPLDELRARRDEAQEPADPEESQRLHLANYYPEEGDDANAPSLAQLQARATLARPGSSANKAEWVQYALTIRHDLSPEDADALTVAALKELKP
jgi:hypothetical protein